MCFSFQDIAVCPLFFFFVIGLCSYLKLGSNEGVLFEINKEMWEGGFYLYPDVPDAGMARSRPVMG